MDKHSNKLAIKDSILPVTTVGVEPSQILKYSNVEDDVVRNELKRYCLSKQERITPEVISEWLRTFQEMNISPKEMVMRIRVAKFKKRYGNQTTIADFLDDEEYFKDYYKYYKRESLK